MVFLWYTWIHRASPNGQKLWKTSEMDSSRLRLHWKKLPGAAQLSEPASPQPALYSVGKIVPSGNQTWQWKILFVGDLFRSKPPFRLDFAIAMFDYQRVIACGIQMTAGFRSKKHHHLVSVGSTWSIPRNSETWQPPSSKKLMPFESQSQVISNSRRMHQEQRRNLLGSDKPQKAQKTRFHKASQKDLSAQVSVNPWQKRPEIPSENSPVESVKKSENHRSCRPWWLDIARTMNESSICMSTRMIPLNDIDFDSW